jgi:hypothetical protein
MRKVVLALMLALAATPAVAQGGLGSLHSSTVKDPVKEEKQRQIDNDYRKALNSIPDAKASNTDPWGSVRQAPSSAKTPQR